MQDSPVESAATAASAALKLTIAGSATAAAGEWWLSNDVLALGGFLMAAIGLCAQVFYLRAAHRIRREEHDMRKTEHKARMTAIVAGATGPTTPGAL